MMNIARSIAIGAVSLSAVALPAVASAATVQSGPPTLCLKNFSISEKVVGTHMYITLTTRWGSITVDPPAVMY